jgi:hypothetical protein
VQKIEEEFTNIQIVTQPFTVKNTGVFWYAIISTERDTVMILPIIVEEILDKYRKWAIIHPEMLGGGDELGEPLGRVGLELQQDI